MIAGVQGNGLDFDENIVWTGLGGGTLAKRQGTAQLGENWQLRVVQPWWMIDELML
jgi:hypothetical protein